MERFDKYKLDDLKTWKKLSWLTTICYGFYCLSLIFNTLLEDVSENVDAMNESNLPLYILFFVIAMHSISIHFPPNTTLILFHVKQSCIIQLKCFT